MNFKHMLRVLVALFSAVIWFSASARRHIPYAHLQDTPKLDQDKTYLVCYYADNQTGEQAWQWARDPDTNQYISVFGKWTDLGGGALLKMDLPRKTLQDDFKRDCEYTGNESGYRNKKTYVEAGIGNSIFSYDHNIWYEEKETNKFWLPFSKFIVFGDSLSDDGNFLNYSHGVFPAGGYYMGRFSNGPVWADYLAQELDLDNLNWALGGATSRIPIPVPYTVETQVTHYENTMLHVENPDYQHTLYSILIGANNYSFEVGADPRKIVNSIEEQVRSLISLGGEYFVIPNLPKLTDTPLFRDSSPQLRKSLDQKIHDHNKFLVEAIHRIKRDFPYVTIFEADLATFLEKVQNHKIDYALKDVKNKCFFGSGIGGLHHKDVCANPEEYLFWDMLHPTTYIHCALTQELIQRMEDQFHLPLPKMTLEQCHGTRIH